MKYWHMSRYTNIHPKQYYIICKSQIQSYLQGPVTTSGDPSLALGMTWKSGGYRGEEVAIRDTCYHFVKLHLRIATSSPPMLLNSVVILSASEGSPYPIMVLLKVL